MPYFPIISSAVNSPHIHSLALEVSAFVTPTLAAGLLSFLLFAGAIHINAQQLRQERNSILAFSTISVLISTALVGSLLYFLCRILQKPVEFIHCLLFGALIVFGFESGWGWAGRNNRPRKFLE
jgi:CPA1 family monovalent cation:H+ antiporter